MTIQDSSDNNSSGKELSPEEAEMRAILELPKVVLHDHLDGGLRPATIIELAHDVNHRLPTEDPEELREWFFDAANSGDLPTYLTTFDHTTAVMQTKDALRRVAREAVEDLASDHVVYAELRFAPEQHQNKGLSLKEVMDATIEGMKEGEKLVAATGHIIYPRLIVCAMRHAQRSTEVAQLTVDYYGGESPGQGYVVGFDIAGAEDGFSPELHEEAFTLLRKNLVPFTIHAGEAAGVESVKAALGQGARRLGHGVRIFEDITVQGEELRLGPVASMVRDQGIILEVCPTSNLQTGVAETLEGHPFSLLHDLGFRLTINTDNRLVSGTTMSEEIAALVEHCDLDIWQYLELMGNAIDAAWMPQTLKEEIHHNHLAVVYESLQAGELEEEDSDIRDLIAGLADEYGSSPQEETIADLGSPEWMNFTMDMLKEQMKDLGLDLGEEDPEEGDEEE